MIYLYTDRYIAGVAQQDETQSSRRQHNFTTVSPTFRSNNWQSNNILVVASMLFVLLTCGLNSMAFAHDKAITFTDIAANDGAGIDYRRAASERNVIIEGYQKAGQFQLDQLLLSPLKSRGAPGVALFDYDRDGDLDIYVTNGPGKANSLYQNLLTDSGNLEFVDQTQKAKVAAINSDSTGTCFGDIDNDGDQDLLVLAFNAPHSLFENQADGSFVDISTTSQVDYKQGAMSCAMGDVNGDGLLDIVIANTANLENILAFFADPFKYNMHNQLYLNMGENTFKDVSATSGIQNLDGIPEGAATLSWAVSIVDIDLDGDQDIVFADDQAAMPNTAQGGVDRGYIQVLENDGSAQFIARAASSTGEWMGLAISDLNCDGHLDIFGSNFGDYGLTLMNPTYQLGGSTSRWLLGQADGLFVDPGVGELIASPFGWGTAALDYDNDGDTDLITHGGMDVITSVDQSNAGVLLRNDRCSASFTRDTIALANSANHANRTVQGVATGDLNNDGFVDIVTVSSTKIPDTAPLTPYETTYGSPFDTDANYLSQFVPIDETSLGWVGTVLENGTLSVEINSADNGNHWVAVNVLGSKDIVTNARVNRDGIGAVVSFKPRRGHTVMQPILGGSSYASQNSLTANFGMGHARKGTVEILWPGGVRNRLYNVRHGEQITFPEIPCSIDAKWKSSRTYRKCVLGAIIELIEEDIISFRKGLRFLISAYRAY
ncbi:MAG: CRTAC1 family protein [Methylococcales bacterium]